MKVLTDAELLLGLARHLAAYTLTGERAALENLETAGKVLDLAFRLRGSTSSSPGRVRAIGLDANLGPSSLMAAIATMEGLGWVDVQRDGSGEPLSVSETIPVAGDLIQSAGSLLSVMIPTAEEKAALRILRATSLQPLLVADVIDTATDLATEEEIKAAVRYLTSTGLVRRVEADDGRVVLFNPNVWVRGDEVAQAALRAADAKATKHVTALLEEVAGQPGIPEVRVTSTSPQWLNFAVSQGLVERSVIQTAEGSERGFLFTPHVARDPFGNTAGDASGHVRQLVGSLVYAATFAKFKLHDPDVFLSALIGRGVAGNVSNIKSDYLTLEKSGIVKVVPGRVTGRYSLELLQSDVAEDALTLLSDQAGSGDSDHDLASLRAQRTYIHAEKARAQIAREPTVDQVEEARLIAALRDTTTKKTMGGRA